MASAAARVIAAAKPPAMEKIIDFAPERIKAPFVLRCAALTIDYIVLLAFPVGWLIVSKLMSATPSDVTIGTAGWVLGFLLFIGDFLLYPLLRGQTVGKMIVGLTILRLDGTGITIGALLRRNLVGYLATVLTLRRLLQMDVEIRTLPDVEIRGQLRFNILEFIYTNKVLAEYPGAELLMTIFLEDVAAHEKQLAYRAKSWRNSLALILRKRAPATAKRIEAKYVGEVDTSGEDYEELRKPGADRKAIIDRAIERVRTGKNTSGVLNIFETVKRTDKEAAERILMAVLDRAEKHPEPQPVALLYRLIVVPLNQPPLEVSPVTMLRYYRCVVAAARIELPNAKPEAYLSTLTPLKRALPKIKEVDKELYAGAQSVMSGYRRTLSKDALAKDELIDRIESGADQLEYVIAEAEAAKDQQTKDYFWGWAATLAANKGNFRQAVQFMMKASHNLGLTDRPKGRDERIYGITNSALRKRDSDSARYAIDHIEDKLVRAKAMLEFGQEFGRWDVKNREEARIISTNALDMMEMTAPDPWSICMAGNTRHQLIHSGEPRVTMQDFTERAVGLINRIPMHGADTKVGTPERAKFLLDTLNRALGCVSYIFRPVMPGRPPIPNPDLASHIKVKEWRLAAEIEAEKYRTYPLPAPSPN